MSGAATDSLGQVSAELAELLEPLTQELAGGNVVAFFQQIGIPLTSGQAATLAPALNTVASGTQQLLDLVPSILAALESGDFATAIQQGLLATVRVGQVIGALETVQAAAAGMHPDAGQIAERTFGFLLARYLDRAQGLNDLLEFFGLLDRQDFNQDPVDPAKAPYTIFTYHFDAIGDWLSDPADKATTLYGWGPGFDGSLLFPRLQKLLALLGLPVIYDATVSPQTLDVVFLELVPTTSGTAGLILKLKDDITLGPQTLPLAPEASLEVQADFAPPVQTQLAMLTDGTVTFTPPSPAPLNGQLGATVTVQRSDPPDPFVLFGVAGGSRLEVQQFVVSALAAVNFSGGSAGGTLDLGATLNGGKVVIDTSTADGFVTSVVPATHMEAEFAVTVGVSSQRGFYFSGSSALEVKLPAHIDLGPVTIEGLTLRAALAGGRIPLSVGADVRALLGPIEAVVQNMGVTATLSFPPHNHGNLGPGQLDITFKPPDGVGLRVDAGPVTGGGFLGLDPARGEYFGALELSFEGVISLKAVGIIDTQLPDGSGFALLILVTAEFTPIQLGFGFTLNGVGGLLGLNHTLDTEALRQGVRSGSVSSILFPPDVVGNISRIVSDLQSFFPLARGHFVVAPMGKLGWGTPTLITIELGVILDIPSPELALIGVLRCILPEEDVPVLRLQVAFAGVIDFDRDIISFDASLFDSSILQFTLSGDMALRIGWGDQSILVITVGGFHPKFQEVPPDLTGLRRIGIALLSGDNPRLVAQSYWAITSNTVQSGSKLELYAAACGFNIYGFLGYDLLVQLSPFHFVADISAGLALRQGDDVICGIGVHCELSGPQPWNANGDASIDFFFFSVDIGFNVTWGSDAPSLPEQLVDVLGLVVGAVQDDRNWRALLPYDGTQTVTIRQTNPAPGTVLLHPFGVLAVSQKVAPLDFAIDRFGNQKPSGDTTFTMTVAAGTTDEVREEFAVANFLTLSDDQKLSRKSFDQLKSGLSLGAGQGAATGAGIDADVTYERSYVHRKRGLTVRAGLVTLLKSFFETLVLGGSIAQSPISVSRRRPGGNGPAAVAVDPEAFQVVNVSDLTPAGPNASAATEAEAFALQAALERQDPTRAGTLQVVAAHELFTASAA